MIVLSGCIIASKTNTQTVPSASSEPTASAESAVSSEGDIPADAETVDCIAEQDLPLTLKATLQDLTVLFIKADHYTADAEIGPGDEITVIYTGDLSKNPTAYQAVKK